MKPGSPAWLVSVPRALQQRIAGQLVQQGLLDRILRSQARPGAHNYSGDKTDGGKREDYQDLTKPYGSRDPGRGGLHRGQEPLGRPGKHSSDTGRTMRNPTDHCRFHELARAFLKPQQSSSAQVPFVARKHLARTLYQLLLRAADHLG